MKFIFKIIIGLIFWLILVDIQWTYFYSHSIENITFLAFSICFIFLIFSGIYWLVKKKRVFKFAAYGSLFFSSSHCQ